jgi:ATP-dependent Clp protease ATP-binding subunit ClpA
MENLDAYLDKFGESGRRILEGALEESRRREQHHISPEHILYMLMTEENDLFDTTMRNLSFDPQDIRLAVEKRLENSYRHIGKGFRIAPETTDIFRCSLIQARSKGRRTIEASDICFVFATDKYNLLNDVLKNPEGEDSAFGRNR